MTSLRLFLQVARTCSFSETARLANLSQPALSRTIKLLEEDLNVRLFDRNSRNVMLTAAGAALVPIVERLTADFDLAFRELDQTFSGERGRVVIGALPSVAAEFLPRAIAKFMSGRSQVEVIIRENLTGGLLQNLQDRSIDLSITIPPAANTAIRFEPMFEDDYVLVCRPEDADDIADPAPWSEFERRPFIAMEPRSSVRMMTDSIFTSTGLQASPRFECAQLATVGGLIGEGLGVSLLPRSTLPLMAVGKPMAWRNTEPPVASRTIGICTLADRTLAPAAEAFRRLLLSAAVDAKF
ncbi:LysR family transcriptional regulator [Novosphingobium aerophilum]|uniref:LysR family transcriptional regulator n=1 Tax=Novosphingobium aerophilum TaxID=2839843 RepID=A0A7X1F540_9SPHN|nr:LysR family transcriptional regulator [Novosphingobium aerophilum]MBC2650498.1 LysR family transcriptional regulator [Novosphingobium aerophilum]